jgi:hypothetical protein
MHFLPKANPLYQHISAKNIVIPDILGKLGNGGFTGYIHHTAPEFEFFALFARGHLLCAVSTNDGLEKSGFEAIVLLLDKVLSVGGELSVYRMTTDLAVCAHALIAGPRLLDGDEVRQVDIRGILARLKVQCSNGVVRFCTPECSTMIFYKDGLPIGFYTDGAAVIESLPDESRRIAALPGARVVVCTTKTAEELLKYDLLQMLNLPKLWESACSRNAVVSEKETAAAGIGTAEISEESLSELVDDLSEVAAAYLLRAGREIVEKRIRERGGVRQLLDSAQRTLFLQQVASDAWECDSHARIDEMIDLMKSEIAARLAV